MISETLSLNKQDLENHLQQEGVRDAGLGYNMVAVFGSQSTGKSTLLNRLFGTEFACMAPDSGRRQTTRGLWLATAPLACPPLLVLDVEGTDGRERGEDQGSLLSDFLLQISNGKALSFPWLPLRSSS